MGRKSAKRVAYREKNRRNGVQSVESRTNRRSSNIDNDRPLKETTTNVKNKNKPHPKVKKRIVNGCSASTSKEKFIIHPLIPNQRRLKNLRKRVYKAIHYLNYWWFRYLMVTELYMVERWERIIIHVLLSILFVILWAFNYCILLSVTGNLAGITPITNIWAQLPPGVHEQPF